MSNPFRTLISHNSISSVLAEYDQSNMAVINSLAGWLEELGLMNIWLSIRSARGSI